MLALPHVTGWFFNIISEDGNAMVWEVAPNSKCFRVRERDSRRADHVKALHKIGGLRVGELVLAGGNLFGRTERGPITQSEREVGRRQRSKRRAWSVGEGEGKRATGQQDRILQ